MNQKVNTKGLPANQTEKIKCIIWDLDHTLWEGVLAEHDELRLRPGIARIIADFDRKGILQSVASRNDHEDAVTVLKKFELFDYFLYPQINWGPKSDSIARIKEQLNIGYNTLAFVDDQQFEREEVRFCHPEVRTFAAEQIDELPGMDIFQPRFITGESSKRRLLYQLDARRTEAEASYDNNQRFLESLDLKFKIELATREDLQRVEELTVRTNQLNATGYTYSYEELEAILEDDGYRIFVAELEDNFGVYGKIGVSLLDCRDPKKWRIKLLLMSCRVMSRGVGNVFLVFLINYARYHGRQLLAEFMPTDRNRVMYITYKFAGFQEVEKLPNNGKILACTAGETLAYPGHVELVSSML